MAAKVTFLVFAGLWSPVPAALFCCATKVYGGNDFALGFHKAVWNDVNTKEDGSADPERYHCGRGIMVELSVYKSGIWGHEKCNVDTWIDKAKTDPTWMNNWAGFKTQMNKAWNTLGDEANKENEKHIIKKTPYYFKKLLAQAAYFGRGTDWRQSPEQTNELYLLAQVTATRRINCKYVHPVMEIFQAVRGVAKSGFNDAECVQLKDKRNDLKKKYCEDWFKDVKDVDEKEKNTENCKKALGRHSGICAKIKYFVSKSEEPASFID
mmetsp:Transcript_16765/g.47718  ORF Transcript_16765/g.47718 Transcript_16765/m.47718 type:complete len:266 (+) Transcript_16765:82-879(+)